MKNLSITELKTQLKQLPKDEIIKLLVESYKIRDEVKIFINARFKGDDGVVDLLISCKDKIRNEFLPEKGYGELRLSVVEKTIASFKTVTKDDILILDLMLFSVEMGVEHINEFGDSCEELADYLFQTYDKVVQFINKKNKAQIFEHFNDRLVAAITNIEGAECWGISDVFWGAYSKIKWQEDYVGGTTSKITGIYAAKIWLGIPVEYREMVLNNVWCGNCKKTVRIKDFTYEKLGKGIVLKGKCSTCISDVVRVIEGD